MPKQNIAASLQGLTGPQFYTGGGLEKQMQLTAESDARKQKFDQDARLRRESSLVNRPMGSYVGAPSEIGSAMGPRMDPQWSAFFESLQQQHAKIGDVEGLDYSQADGTVPLSMQGLDDWRTESGRPVVSVSKRGR